jgi:hypothetical protein
MQVEAMKIVLIGIIVFSLLTMEITSYFDVANWQISVGFIVLAVVLYFTTDLMARYYVKKGVPEGAGDETEETTEGHVMFPPWLRIVGLLAISSLITAAAPWAITFFKQLN